MHWLYAGLQGCACCTEAVAGVCRCVLMCVSIYQHCHLYHYYAEGHYLAKHGYLLVWLYKLLSWCGVSLAHSNVEQNNQPVAAC